MRSFLISLIFFLGACIPITNFQKPIVKSQKNEPAYHAKKHQEIILKKTSFNKINGWKGDNHDLAVSAFLKSCVIFKKQPIHKSLGAFGSLYGDWSKSCEAANALSPGSADLARQFFENYFQPYLVTYNLVSEGLFTGYFEIELNGSWLRKGSYTTPIFSRPPELVDAHLGDFKAELKGQNLSGKIVGGRFVPFEDRETIVSGALSGRGIELIWVDSPIDAFFLHIQGSGRVIMDDGSIIRIGYAARNGHKYYSIGKELIKMGELTPDRVSMQSIRSWLMSNPKDAAKLMAKNKSFIFFQVKAGAITPLDDKQGPIGAQGVSLTPERSIAVDRRFIPLGVPLWLDTTDPINLGDPLRRLVIAQDTGSAITGAIRGDLFWGFGSLAATKAGLMKQKGRYFVLLPKQ